MHSQIKTLQHGQHQFETLVSRRSSPYQPSLQFHSIWRQADTRSSGRGVDACSEILASGALFSPGLSPLL